MKKVTSLPPSTSYLPVGFSYRDKIPKIDIIYLNAEGRAIGNMARRQMLSTNQSI